MITSSFTSMMKLANMMLKAFLLFFVIVANEVNASASDWLMKINGAAAEVNFSGIFVYTHEGKVEVMQVTRRVDDGMMQERLYALNGEAREIIRDMSRVWCYIPDQNVGVHDYRQISESGFPRIVPGDFDKLSKNYTFSEGGYERIADRRAHQINVIPKDPYRYGYVLWADEESGLLLRSDLVDHSGNIIEQYMFVDVEIGIDIPDSALQAVSNKDQLEWFGNANPPISAPSTSSSWLIGQVPGGFQLSKHIRRMSPMEAEEVEHLVYTDGLSTISVFIKEARVGQSSMKGLLKMGAVHAYRNTIEHYRVTVMGEVPAQTVQFVSQGISYKQ
ncbi:MAG: hypothetical protein GKR95_22140 [Gammaproteobacteria bacterium]|nr:hypothetical protein [Gammaproteobacteria bacterium]